MKSLALFVSFLNRQFTKYSDAAPSGEMEIKMNITTPDNNFEECCEQHHHSLEGLQIPDTQKITLAADFFKAFADPTRVRILCALWESELCVCDISELVGMSQSAVSHQLRYLRQSKLIKCRREGKSVIYSLADHHVRLIINCALEHINE